MSWKFHLSLTIVNWVFFFTLILGFLWVGLVPCIEEVWSELWSSSKDWDHFKSVAKGEKIPDPAGWLSAKALPRHDLPRPLDTTCPPSPLHR